MAKKRKKIKRTNTIINNKEIALVNAIVVFIDILGYKKLVTKMSNDDEFTRRFDKLMYGITVDVLEELKKQKRPDLAHEHNIYLNKIWESLSIRCIYDNIIFSLPLSDINFDSKFYDKKTTILNCIETLLSCIAMTSSLFIVKMGHLLRGGISIGKHYESERNNYLFIFSEAHNKAVSLESMADYPRILLDDELLSYLNEISYPINRFFYKDEDERYCFDIYSIFAQLEISQSIKYLSDIRDGVSLNIQDNLNNDKEIKKLAYFANYHNKYISGKPDFADLIIRI